MAALTTARAPTIQSRFVRIAPRPLAASVKAIQGAAAMIILSGTGKGYFAPADDAKIGVVVGIFRETVDNSSGAIGALSAKIDFCRDRELFPYVNDSGSALDATDREGPAYVLDDQTVTGTVGTAVAGCLYEVDANNVAWVEHNGFLGPDESLSSVAPVDPSSSAASAGSASTAARQDHLHHIPLALPTAEGLMSAAQASAIHAPVADMTALKAIAAADRSAGMLCLVLAGIDGLTLWRFHATSTAADTSENLVAVPAAGSGRWLRADRRVCLSLAVGFGTADAAALFTVPVGARVKPVESWWDVDTSFAGGSSSAIGIYSSVTGWDTPGDILGGAGGDVAATLVSTNTRQVGTVGTKLDTLTDGRLIMIAADTLNFDRTVSVFTSGAGKARVLCELLANPGA